MSIEAGNLRDFSLPDIFQIVSLERRSGQLEIQSLGWKGHVHFRDGQVDDAAFGEWTGEEAVYLLFTSGEGQFQFREVPSPETPSAYRAAADLIAEGLRRKEAWMSWQEKLPGLLLSTVVARGAAPCPPGADEEARRLLKYLDEAQAQNRPARVVDVIHHLHLLEDRTGELLALLVGSGAVHLIGPAEQGVQQLFDALTHFLFEKFAAISGWRMVEGFVALMQQELSARDDPPVQLHFENQRLRIDWLHSSLDPGQADAYRQLLHFQIDYIGKVHGTDFVQRLLGDHYQTLPSARQHLWSELGLPLPQVDSKQSTKSL